MTLALLALHHDLVCIRYRSKKKAEKKAKKQKKKAESWNKFVTVKISKQ